MMGKQVVNRDREETGKVFLSVSTPASAGFLSGTLPHTPLVFWGLWEAPSSLAEVFAKPAHRREAGRLPPSGCCALLNLAVSMKQTSVSARLRELSRVRALSLRAKHMNCAKDPAVSDGKDERVCYQSWEKREHLPEGIWACHETEGEQGASRPHSNYGSLCCLSLQNWWEKLPTHGLLLAVFLVLPFFPRLASPP